MSHANATTANKIRLKKLKEQNKKKQLEWSKLDNEEKEFIIKARSTKPLKGKVKVAMWDLNHSQYPKAKYNLLISMLKNRLEEIYSENDPDTDETELKEINETLTKLGVN